MALQMKRHCEKCEKQLGLDSTALICSYECTYCADCAKALKNVCPNCQGELVARPTRRPEAEDAKAACAPVAATTPFSAYIDG